MKKPLTSRIAGLAVLYCLIFCILVLLQFSNQGSFSLTAGSMTIRGKFLQNPEERIIRNNTIFELYDNDSIHEITDGVKIYYGGLEFNLSEERGKGLTLYGIEENISVNPEYLILTNNIARFILPDGTTLVFNSFNTPRQQDSRGAELRIHAEFAEDISEITIPVIPRRSSLIRDSGQLGIMYSGSRYLFNRSGGELENGFLTLSRENSSISYRSRGRQRTFDPTEYIITQAGDYEGSLDNWKSASFNYWNQNAAFLQNEEDIIAYCSESFIRGSYPAAVAAISRDFINSSMQSHRSSPFIGGMANAYRMFVAGENEKSTQISRLAADKSLDIFKEEHILDYLFTRSNSSLANEIIDIIKNIKPESIIIDHCPGILEVVSDIRRWRPSAENPAEHLIEQMVSLVSENLVRDTENNHVFVLNFEGMNLDFSLRMGKAIIPWAESAQNAEWEAIGKSLVISALESSGDGAGKLYNTLRTTDYYPRAAWLTDNNQWAWTVSSLVRASAIDGDLNIAFTFPVNMTHYVIIRGIRPFLRLQLYGTDWRSEPQFERSDSSGWIYYPQDQILILKLRHRTAIENVRIIYREPPPPPPVQTEETGEPEA